VVVFTCQRQAAAGALAPSLTGAGQAGDTLHCVLPCVGMVDPDWTRDLFGAGTRDIAFVSCPHDDCANREGPHWLSARLKRRKGLLRPSLHWLETAPGETRPLASLFERLKHAAAPAAPPALPGGKEWGKAWPRFPVAVLVLLLVTILALPLDISAGRVVPGMGEVRILIEHQGNVITSIHEAGIALPEHVYVDTAQIMGGTRYPVHLQVWVNGELALEENHSPAGLRKEGKISAMDSLALPIGTHTLELRLNDNGDAWRVLFHQTLQVRSASVYTLIYDQSQDAFTLH
jgi:hypothetical protein